MQFISNTIQLFSIYFNFYIPLVSQNVSFDLKGPLHIINIKYKLYFYQYLIQIEIITLSCDVI